MINVFRAPENPLLSPNPANSWEAAGAFNGSVAFGDGAYHLVYRAFSKAMDWQGKGMQVSSIGYAKSADGVHFTERRQLFAPTEEWEKYSCEDPRITKIGATYYIFYTALSQYPFNAAGIKVGVAITKDFKNIEKHSVTPFNSKAMSLFPELINGKLTAILSVNTDQPPTHVCLAIFDRPEDIWSEDYWRRWYDNLEDHILPLARNSYAQVEAGAPPLKTKAGWLVIYSYIHDYFAPPATFGIEAVLLDPDNPAKIIGRTKEPIMVPETAYEHAGNVANIVFPSGALIEKDRLHIYYGASDTTTCRASLPLKPLLQAMLENGAPTIRLRRQPHNPIIKPIPGHAWEAKAVFNAGFWYENEVGYIIYRAMSNDNTSVLGCAQTSADGLNIVERLPEPIYVPRESFEKKMVANANSGCEDPRLTRIGKTLYMCYTAFDGQHVPRAALTSIAVKDFLARKWDWSTPQLISSPGVFNKDVAIFPKKIKGKYAILHRPDEGISLDFEPDLEFGENHWLDGEVIMRPRKDDWDSVKIGIAAPPIETRNGWLLLYHGVSIHNKYRLGAALLDLKDPTKVLRRTDEPILEPEMDYEKNGQVPNVVFSCGAAVIGRELIVYYGAADSVIGIAKIDIDEVFGKMKAAPRRRKASLPIKSAVKKSSKNKKKN